MECAMPPLVERLVSDVEYAALFGEGRPLSARLLGELLPGRAYVRTPPVYFDTSRVGPECARTIDDRFATREVPPLPISLIEIDEALVFGQGSVVLPDGRLLHESAREFINAGRPPDGALATREGWRLPERTIERFPGRTLLVKRPWYRNYGHWLVDLMPLIPLVARHAVAVDSILFGEVADGPTRNAMAGMAAAFLPRAKVVFVDDERQIRCETLLYVTPPHIAPIFMHPQAMQLAADAARVVADVPSGEAPPSSLYVSRQKTGARRIINAEAVEAALGAAGFETVFPEDLDFSDQVALFSRAARVAGVKGAGLANIMFCRPGTEVLVFSPGDFPDPFFWDLATPRGLAYAEIFSRAPASLEAPQGKSDIEVDLISLGRYLAGERPRTAPKLEARKRFSFRRA